MAHKRKESVQSTASLSSLTSISSRTSIESYESLKDDIIDVERSPIDLQALVDVAEKIINERFVPSPKNTYTYKNSASKPISVHLDAVMIAMLAAADELAPSEELRFVEKGGKRYVASAIVACSRKGDDEDVIDALAALGITWLTHFLFIFKTSRSHDTQPNQEPHELATPTLQVTASHLGEAVRKTRHASFPDDVLKRDGYKCVLTGYQDAAHPEPDENVPTVFLQAAHILRRAIGKFDENHNSDSFRSALASFDILVNYTRLPVTTLEELQNHLDDPSNGMMLQRDAHDAFDRFSWCLKKTNIDNMYSVKIFKTVGILHAPAFVSFRDHSDDFNSGSTSKRNRPVSLPDPEYIRIHAAIAGILNMSGAGKFFDELLDKYKDDEGKVPPVHSWPELENLMVEEELRESVAESLKSVQVH